ncbi:MAG: 3-hydroxyacyl-CoA dehydrogenase NAD-binding domain-containing protein [Gammaproteobacteria bacterium]|nr:3-hydroxyacyl-CoA dehydrogenase NAD-binding domain-containing protein [Gammaproteobacteria bacterium]
MNESHTQVPAHWQSETDNAGIVWLCIDKEDSSANVLSGPVLEQLAHILEPYETAPPRGLIIYSGKSNGFVMGADINEFTTINDPDEAYRLIRLGQQILDRLEGLTCPTVAVINGFALGGGLELAMACDFRLAHRLEKPVIGLPEVQLGLHPGFGGTVRAVRLAGVRAAMQLMLTGKSITVSKARRQGLVDRICDPSDWKKAASELVESDSARSGASLMDRLLNLAPVRPFIARTLRKQVATKARPEHYPAPYAIIDLWAEFGASPKTGYDAEARSMAQLMCSDTARNLIRVFFLQNRMKSQGQKTTERISTVHVIGAGVMGGDIAAWCALRGLEVTLQDREMKYIEPALARAEKLFAKKVRNDDERETTAARLRADVEGAGVAAADLIIEAIFEDRGAKQSLYATVEESMQEHAILATNTSSIRLEDLRTDLKHPERFIGLHFFNPVAQLPLVEIIRCADTDDQILNRAFAFTKKIGKLPLECSSSPGFVVNRVLAPYMAEAMHLVEDGVALADIDAAAESFGMPMGPVELIDSVGIDVAMQVSNVLGSAFDRPVPSRLADMVEQKHLGRKSGQGFYRWENGKSVKPEATAEQRSKVSDDMVDRLMLPMVNEAVACLHEKIVSDGDLLDAGVIFGTGFAPFRGGPLQYARERGIGEVVDALLGLAQKYGDRFRPHVGWSELNLRND